MFWYPRVKYCAVPGCRLREIVPAACWSMLDTEALLSAAASPEAREELLESQPHLPAYVLSRRAPLHVRALLGKAAEV